jgi:hypothetical protein
MTEPRWHWRNCRSLGFNFSLWLWPWHLAAYRNEDVYGGERWLHVGPLSVGITFSIGNASSENPVEARTALHETDAYDRALSFEGRAA